MPTAADEPRIVETSEDQEVTPLQVLTSDSFVTAAQIGVGVSVELNPELKVAKECGDFAEIVMEQSVVATDFRNDVVQSHLLLVSAEAKKLGEIRARDGNLDSDEAKAILADLRQGHFAQDSPAMFLAKSVFSGRMAYGVASQYAIGRATDKRAAGLSTGLLTGDRVELLWVGKKSFVRTYTNIPWKYLKVLGKNSKQFTNALQRVLLQEIGKRIGRIAVENTLDKVVGEILNRHPSIPEAAYSLRLDMMVEPHALLPMAQAAQPALIAVPREIRVQRDPVVSAASVQQQVFQEQHYEVASSGGNESAHAEPMESHPTHVSISGSSFTGGSGSSLFSRY